MDSLYQKVNEERERRGMKEETREENDKKAICVVWTAADPSVTVSPTSSLFLTQTESESKRLKMMIVQKKKKWRMELEALER